MRNVTPARSGSLSRTSARYVLAISAVAVALFAAWPLYRLSGSHAAPILLFPALVYCSLYCGVGPSITAAAVSLLAVRYWFVTPVHNLAARSSNLVDVVTFVLSIAIIIVLAENHRRSSEVLRSAHKELDEQVKERTTELNTANTSLRQLTARLLHIQDDERRRFARELHDSVGQTLAALGMNLSLVRSDIDRMMKTTSTLADSETLVQEMSKEIRTISHLLHPPLLDEAGLVSALRWFAEGFSQRSNIHVDLDISDDFGRLPRELETAVFRVVQECLTNIHRHSGSPTANIQVARVRGEVLIEVADSGRGISKEKQEDLASVASPGVGIAGMRERIRQLGGSLEINSDTGGTLISVHLPIPAASIAAA